jgi:hypothetical protein
MCIYIYPVKDHPLNQNPRHLRQRCAQFKHFLLAHCGSQLFLGVLPVRKALLKLFPAGLGQAKKPESPVGTFLGLHPSMLFEELQHPGQASGIKRQHLTEVSLGNFINMVQRHHQRELGGLNAMR